CVSDVRLRVQVDYVFGCVDFGFRFDDSPRFSRGLGTYTTLVSVYAWTRVSSRGGDTFPSFKRRAGFVSELRRLGTILRVFGTDA
ncbi:unnamed protein product, partial [Amoebophrya sp. A25]